VLLATPARCAKPTLVRFCDVFGNDLAWNNMEAESLSRRTERNENIVMVWGDEALALLIKHPISRSALIGFALDCDRSSSGLIRGNNINAACVSQRDGCDVPAS
jgi:hypothetical protein